MKMTWIIIGIIYLIFAIYFIIRFSRSQSQVGIYYESSFMKVIAGLLFPLTMLIIIGVLLADYLESTKPDYGGLL